MIFKGDFVGWNYRLRWCSSTWSVTLNVRGVLISGSEDPSRTSGTTLK
jgi:hypothetical protein